MANTEGMSDEDMAYLLSTTTEEQNISRHPSNSQTLPNQQPHPKSKAKSSWLRERMMMDMGDHPAATVIRPSPKKPVESSTSTAGDSASKPDEDETSEPSAHANALPPLVGSIVERNIHKTRPQQENSDGSNPKGETNSRIGRSKFSQSRGDLANVSVSVPPSTGFPSVHVPFGTFVQRRNKKPTPAVTPPKNKKSDTTVTNTATSINTINPNDVNALKDLSRRDANSLLQSMSSAEIQEHVQELETALSPETIAFLRSRRQKKVSFNQPDEKHSAPDVAATLSIAFHGQSPSKRTNDSVGIPNEREEKKRLAALLSSIRTYEDLDKAYAVEMGFNTDNTPIPGEVTDNRQDDFNEACELLRSTAPRQRLWAARVVSQHLLKAQDHQSFYGSTWPYPILLPVSLRCLLDTRSDNSSYHVLLYTYVLQSIYALLRSGAHPLHVVDVTDKLTTEATIYQHCFLDDAIPTVPFGTAYPISVEPLATDENNASTENDGTSPTEEVPVAYATSSSSTSSQSDGEAFRRDPMWTLLSKMRILPRLAQILEHQPRLPPEAMVAVCGILAMLSVRSPGAGTAIAQHPQIMSKLMEQAMCDLSMWHGNDDHTGLGDDNGLLLPIMILLCTLARQSVVVAKTIDEHFLPTLAPPILAQAASSDRECRLQRWTLCLWRTLLRYGFGLSGLATMISLSAAQLTAGQVTEHSLAIEFSTAFSNVFDCIRVVSRPSKNGGMLDASSEAYENLIMAGAWLSSTVRQTIYQLSQSSATNAPLDREQLSMKWRLHAARLRLVSSFLSCTNHEGGNELTEEVKTQDMTDEERMVCLTAGNALLDHGYVESALRMIAPFAFSPDFELATPIDHDLALESSACAFLEAFSIFINTLIRHHIGNPELPFNALVSRFDDLVAACWQPDRIEPQERIQTTRQRFDQPRKGWINRSLFAVVKCFPSIDKTMTQVPSIVRLVALALLGRLQMGDEAIVALLLSNDSLFQCCSIEILPSPRSGLSSMLLHDLCRGERRRRQLQHSLKLHRGYGMSDRGLHSLDSLLSEGHEANVGSADTLLLPLGQLWLWQVFSSSFHFQLGEDATMAIEEAAEIIESCLELVLELERTASNSIYITSLDRGAKLYHLFNLCLLPESLLGKEQISRLASELFDIYSKPLDDSIGPRFAQACNAHSRIAKHNLSIPENDKDLLNSAKILGLDLGESETRALEDFVNDLCEAYIGYGAQYDICTKCIRYFILPCFPTKIRCDLLQRLREVHHLLTLPSELDDPNEEGIRALLEMTLTGGIPNVDGSLRDPPALLDALASCLKVETGERTEHGYVFLLSVALLARSLAYCVGFEASGFEAASARIHDLPGSVAQLVVDATSLLLSTGGSKTLLVDAVLNNAVLNKAHALKEKVAGLPLDDFQQYIKHTLHMK